ncbi:MAG: chorismate synthase [Lachnospiraceae bacterium]|nr:chorismate synthase [Lachnospiraceae bacterium]
MSGSIYGKLFTISTFGESHGPALGVVIDGCPAGLKLCEEDIQVELDKRRPGVGAAATKRNEADRVHILSGVFEARTLGTPIALVVYNEDAHSSDYSALKDVYRPGHADYGFDAKFGMRDHRGGGRSSGRETLARVAAGAVAKKILKSLGIELTAYTLSIGPIRAESFDASVIYENPYRFADPVAAAKADSFVSALKADMDSAGGVIECRINGVPAGIGDPVFDKLDARLAGAMVSIGAVKGIEIGDGFAAAMSRGSENNDPFDLNDGKIVTTTNHAGGILGGMSTGCEIVFRVAVKPTPSIAKEQQTVTKDAENTTIQIKGRHDTVIVPRAVPVVEAMAAITIADALLCNMGSRIDRITDFYKR